MEISDVISLLWGPLVACIGLIIVLAKMHNDISILKEKVATLFNLWNDKDK